MAHAPPRASEVPYYEGLTVELFSKWESLAAGTTHIVEVVAGGSDRSAKRVGLLRRIAKTLQRFEIEIAFIGGRNWVEEQCRTYLRLFDYEAKLRWAMATGRSLGIPLKPSALAHTTDAVLFYESFQTAVMEWVQALGLVRRRGENLSDEMVTTALCSSTTLLGNLQANIHLALNAADGNFKNDELDDDTKVILMSYSLKLKQLALKYHIPLPPAAHAVAAEQAALDGGLPVRSPGSVVGGGGLPQDPVELNPYYVDDEERRNVEAVARRIIERSRREELERAGDATPGFLSSKLGIGPSSAAPVPWTRFDPTGQPKDYIRTKLVQFYTLYNPVKVEDVDAILEHYDGREHELFAALETKYLGLDPAPVEHSPPTHRPLPAPESASTVQQQTATPREHNLSNGVDEAPQEPPRNALTAPAVPQAVVAVPVAPLELGKSTTPADANGCVVC